MMAWIVTGLAVYFGCAALCERWSPPVVFGVLVAGLAAFKLFS